MSTPQTPLDVDQDARDAARAYKVAEQMELERARREARRRLDAEERGTVATPELVPLSDFLAQPDPIIRYRIDGLQPIDSRLMVVAQFKAGKTTLRDNLLRALVDGDPFLGAHPVRPIIDGTVAVLDTEMAPTLSRRWLRDQHIRHADRVVVTLLRGQAGALDLLSPDGRAQWADWLRAHQVRYLVLDCLRPVLDALGLNEHTDAGRFLVAFDALLTAADIPEACIIHHMGHVGERSRGDSRIIDWADVTVKLVRQDDDPASPRYLSAYGRDVDLQESRLEYDALTRRLTVVGGSRHDARIDGVIDAIVDVLTATLEPLSGRRIKEALEDSEHGRNTIDAALKAGARAGRLIMEPGARNSRLYRVSRSVPAVSLEQSAERVSQCPPPLYREGHSGHSATPDVVPETSVSQRDTQSGKNYVSRF